MSLFRRILAGKFTSAEVLELNCSNSAKVNVFVIPGNPGQAHFYAPFMRELHRLFDGSASIYAITYAGFDCSIEKHKTIYTLEEQITHNIEVVRHILSESPAENTILIGHSIGAHIALEIVDRINIPKVKVCAVFPFLEVNNSCYKQSIIRFLAHYWRVAGLLANALMFIPEWLRKFCIQVYARNLDDHAVEAALKLLHQDVITNALFLAKCEFESLDRPIPLENIRKLGRSFSLFGAHQDKWFPKFLFLELSRTLTSSKFFWCEDLSHDFCVSTRMSVKVAQLILDSLKINDDEH